MGLFEHDDNLASDGVCEIRMECISQVEGTGGLWWVAEGFVDGSNKPRGLFNGRAQAEELARGLADAAGVPLKVKSYAE